jgi:hypothetical protein
MTTLYGEHHRVAALFTAAGLVTGKQRRAFASAQLGRRIRWGGDIRLGEVPGLIASLEELAAARQQGTPDRHGCGGRADAGPPRDREDTTA